LVVGSIMAGCFVAACADIFGIHNADVDGSVADGGGDALPDYVFYDKVPIDANTAVCEGGVPVVADNQAFWISGRLGSDAVGCGTKTKPCQTINYLLTSINAADAGVRTVYLDDSQFLEQLDLSGQYRGFTFQGGFQIDAGVWTPACENNLTYITAPDDGGAMTIFAHGMLDGGLTLRLMQVETKTNGNVGESVYALLVVDSDVLLDNVNLYAQNGGPGAVGSNGSNGLGCTKTGGTGAHGTDGGAGNIGSFTTTQAGFVPSIADSGTNGELGTSMGGTAGACQSCVTGCN
jgi:hypothetical protein